MSIAVTYGNLRRTLLSITINDTIQRSNCIGSSTNSSLLCTLCCAAMHCARCSLFHCEKPKQGRCVMVSEAEADLSDVAPNYNQCFLMHFILGTYFGPHINTEAAKKKSILQRVDEALNQFTFLRRFFQGQGGNSNYPHFLDLFPPLHPQSRFKNPLNPASKTAIKSFRYQLYKVRRFREVEWGGRIAFRYRGC